VEREKRTQQAQIDEMTIPLETSRGPVQRYFNRELDVAYMSIVIILCFFISGLIDSVAFNSWNCFVDMQTGTGLPHTYIT
jgi:hypothetical protein